VRALVQRALVQKGSPGFPQRGGDRRCFSPQLAFRLVPVGGMVPRVAIGVAVFSQEIGSDGDHFIRDVRGFSQQGFGNPVLGRLYFKSEGDGFHRLFSGCLRSFWVPIFLGGVRRNFRRR